MSQATYGHLMFEFFYFDFFIIIMYLFDANAFLNIVEYEINTLVKETGHN